MKKIVLFAAVVFGLSTMNAQKNSILLGGNVGYSHDEVKLAGNKDKADKFVINPYLGYQFTDNWTAGVKLGYEHSKFHNEFGYKTKADLMKIGGFLRYTQPFSETFAIYGDIDAGWVHDETKVTLPTGESKVKGDGFYVGFTPALFINFKNNFGLNFSIGGVEYSHMKQKGGSKTDGVDVTFGNAFNIGISKNFRL